MDKTAKLQFQRDVENYLEENKIYDLFENLMKDLVIAKDPDPISFLINKLQKPDVKKIFLVGPPCSGVTGLALELADNRSYDCFSVGQILKKELSKKSDLGWKIQKSIENYSYVTDDIVCDVVMEEIKKQEQKEANYIVEGFPKTRVQALALQKAGIIPNTFMIYHIEEDKLKQNCLKKLKENQDGHYNNISESEQQKYADNYSQEYIQNIEQVKEVYARNYFQIDGSKNFESKQDLEDMANVVKFQIDNNGPRRSQKIIVTGPPGSGRSTLAKNLAKKHGFVYVSTRELISDQIAKNTNIGKLALERMKEGELVPEDIVIGLVSSRIQQVDCHLQGYVLDGFPKSQVQLIAIQNLKINPTLVVVLQCDEKISEQRLSSQQIDPVTGVIYSNASQITDTNVKKRLVKAPNTNPQQIRNRIKVWQDLYRSLQNDQAYNSLLFQIETNDQDPQNILEKVSNQLEKNIQ